VSCSRELTVESYNAGGGVFEQWGGRLSGLGLRVGLTRVESISYNDLKYGA